MDFCKCPNPDALPTIPTSDCMFNLKQIVKMALVKRGGVIWATDDGSGTGTGGVPVADMDLVTISDWTAQLVATDDSKIVITPLLYNPIITAGEVETFGGANETPFGIPINVGVSASTFTASFTGITPAQEKALKQIACHSDLEAYFFNQNGEIIYRKTSTGEIKGFDIYSFFVGSRTNNGYNTLDTNSVTFSLMSNWSTEIEIVKPVSWNPLNL